MAASAHHLHAAFTSPSSSSTISGETATISERCSAECRLQLRGQGRDSLSRSFVHDCHQCRLSTSSSSSSSSSSSASLSSSSSRWSFQELSAFSSSGSLSVCGEDGAVVKKGKRRFGRNKPLLRCGSGGLFGAAENRTRNLRLDRAVQGSRAIKANDALQGIAKKERERQEKEVVRKDTGAVLTRRLERGRREVIAASSKDDTRTVVATTVGYFEGVDDDSSWEREEDDDASPPESNSSHLVGRVLDRLVRIDDGRIAVRYPSGDVNEISISSVSSSCSSSTGAHGQVLLPAPILLQRQENDDPYYASSPKPPPSLSSSSISSSFSSSSSLSSSSLSSSPSPSPSPSSVSLSEQGGGEEEAGSGWTSAGVAVGMAALVAQQAGEGGVDEEREREREGEEDEEEMGVRDTPLASTSEHRLWVAATAAALGDILLQCTDRVHDLPSLSAAGIGTLAGYLVADLLTGFYHWGVDNYGDVNTPVFGAQIDAFQGHHQRPWTIAQRQFANNTHAICKPVLAFLTPILLLTQSISSPLSLPQSPLPPTSPTSPTPPPLSLSPILNYVERSPFGRGLSHMHAMHGPPIDHQNDVGQLFVSSSGNHVVLGDLLPGMASWNAEVMASAAGYGFLFAAVSCIVLSQQFHAWAHSKKSQLPWIVLQLQDAGLLVSRREHGLHHRPPYEGHYAIVSGIWNRYLDENKVMYRLEKRIYQIWGVAPRSWLPTDTSWLEELGGGEEEEEDEEVK